MNSSGPGRATPVTCEHESTSMVVVVHCNGSRHVHVLCDRCYAKLRAVKRRDVPYVAELPSIRNDEWYQHRLPVLRAECAVRQEMYEAQRALRREMYEAQREIYHDYLASDEWKEKRDRIMQRSGGICEYCCKWWAEVVHHETYERIFEEADEDLVAICHECHTACHGGSDDLSDHPARALLEKVA